MSDEKGQEPDWETIAKATLQHAMADACGEIKYLLMKQGLGDVVRDVVDGYLDELRGQVKRRAARHARLHEQAKREGVDPFLTVGEAAVELRLTSWTVRRYIRIGALRARRVMGRWLIPREEMDRLLRGQTG